MLSHAAPPANEAPSQLAFLGSRAKRPPLSALSGILTCCLLARRLGWLWLLHPQNVVQADRTTFETRIRRSAKHLSRAASIMLRGKCQKEGLCNCASPCSRGREAPYESPGRSRCPDSISHSSMQFLLLLSLSSSSAFFFFAKTVPLV